MERSTWAFAFFQPSLLLSNALKPIHCDGWVCYFLLCRHLNLNNAQNTLLSSNSSPILNISEILQPYEGGLVAVPTSVNAGDLGQI